MYSEASGGWVASRTIWNQHAYYVTNINEDATVPSTEVQNWTQEGLNNFRQNVQGALADAPSADLTAQPPEYRCDNDEGIPVTVRVCNRGGVGIAPGRRVGFFAGDPRSGGTLACTAEMTVAPDPGECVNVECLLPPDAIERSQELWVRPDDNGLVGECNESNNLAVATYLCGGVI